MRGVRAGEDVCSGPFPTQACVAHMTEADCVADAANLCEWQPTGNCFGPPFPGLAAQDCVCIVFRGQDTVDGLSDQGFVGTTDGCRAYRALYPADIECVGDRAWSTLP